MSKLGKMTFKLVVVTQIFVLFLLAGCTASFPENICHATDDSATPYEVITITNSTQVKEHLGHTNDIYPVPEGGCPTIPVIVTNGQITICHATGSTTTNPYNEITVSVKGLNGHAKHEGDIMPAPETGCPTSILGTDEGKITICHATNSDKNPYVEIIVSINGLNGHGNHEGDIIPVPEGGCPATKQ